MAHPLPTDRSNTIHVLVGHSTPLDMLRAVSLLAVIANHCTHAAGLNSSTLPADQFFHSLVTSMWMLLELFFALSGYLVTSIILAAKRQPGTMLAFYARRTLRLFPLFYAYLISVHFLLPALGVPLLPAAYVEKWPWHILFSTNILTAIDGIQHRVVAHFWTLAAEEQFYLVWPWIANFLPVRISAGICVAALSASTGMRFWLAMFHPETPAHVYVLPHLHWDALVFGSLAALAAGGDVPFLRSRTLWKCIFVVGGIATFALGVPGMNMAWGGPKVAFGYLVLGAWFAATIALAVRPWAGRERFEDKSAVHPLKRSSPLVILRHALGWISRVSYGAYVFHTPVIHVLGLENGFYAAMTPDEGGSRIVGYIICYVATLGFTLMLAAASWQYFEEPIYNLRSRFPYRPIKHQPPATETRKPVKEPEAAPVPVADSAELDTSATQPPIPSNPPRDNSPLP
jgi:peptidoglycan/LPS O-acetylase OafA/YrhL